MMRIWDIHSATGVCVHVPSMSMATELVPLYGGGIKVCRTVKLVAANKTVKLFLQRGQVVFLA